MPFALSMAAGIWLVRGLPRARQIAYITQALQIPVVILPIVTWKFIAGIIASIAFTSEGIRLYRGLEVTYLVGSGSLGNLAATIGINLMPILLIVLLARAPTEASRAT